MAEILNPHDVQTTVKYLVHGSTNERYFSNGIEVNTGTYEDVPVVVKDARPARSSYTLENGGFTLVEHVSKVKNLRDRSQLDTEYTPEMLKLVKDVTGADKVILYSPPVLRQNKDSPGSNYQPKAADVHTDWSPGNAEWTARERNPEIDSYSRFMFINVWRPLSDPPQDWPLALIDARTVESNEGVVYPMLVVPKIPDQLPMRPLPEHTVEGANFVHKPHHDWRYFSNMTPDEAIVFKLYDSDCKKGSKSWRCPHTAFFDSRDGTNPRESEKCFPNITEPRAGARQRIPSSEMSKDQVDFSKCIGFKYDPVPVSWNKREILLFANSIGVEPNELHLLYELHPHFQAVPTYPLIMGFKGTEFEVVNFYEKASARFPPGLPKIDWSRGVDGERYIEIMRPIPTTSAGKRFELRRETIGAYDKGKAGLVLEEQTVLVDESGEVYTKFIGSSFFVGQGGYGGPKGPKKPSHKPPADKKPDVVAKFHTTPGQALLYRLNGDYNPLHADPTIGPKMGFKGAILHGLCTYNIAAVQVLRAFGNSDPANFKSFEARFSAPVLPGDELETLMWTTGKTINGAKEIIFETRVNGKPVLGNGRALIISKEKAKL